MTVAWFGSRKGAIRLPTTRRHRWPDPSIPPNLARLEEAVTVLFCLV